ncbi:MAG: ParA family protein [Thermosphaera sp.]
MYDYVLCDTPPELFQPTILGLYAADYIIIPSNMDELSREGAKLFLKDVLPEIMTTKKVISNKSLRVLGVVLVNTPKRCKQKTFNKLNADFTKFIKNYLPPVIAENIYERPLFNTIIHRNRELADLIYRPRRRGLPLDRVLKRHTSLRWEVESFREEVLTRMRNFRGLT